MVDMPTLVLVHGGPGFDHSPFKTFFPALAGHCQIVYYDHRGMGRSDPSCKSERNLKTWAQDLSDLLDTLGIQTPIILGQSFGGFVAMRYAIDHGDRLAGLVLSSTAARHVPEDCLAQFEVLGGVQVRNTAQPHRTDV
jgi:proline iminopeptidase